MRKYSHSETLSLLALLLVSLFTLFLIAACSTSAGSAAQPTPAKESLASTEVAVSPKPAPSLTLAADPTSVYKLIESFTAAGASVVNNGRAKQGLFPGAGIQLWQLTANEARIKVYEFANSAARQAISDNISPTGYEFTMTSGDATYTTNWDGEGYPHFWASDNLIVNYWGEDEAAINLLNEILGPPFADGSVPYQPEPNSSAAAGISEYGISFQYDPYLSTGIQPQLVDAYTDTDGMTYMLLPQHIDFTFSNSYAESEPLLQRYQLNLETMPQIVIYPTAAYASIQPLAGTQIDLLQTLLEQRPLIPGGTLPYLPLQNTAQAFHTQLAYLDFINGTGVRYVTAFSQGVSPMTNQDLVYTFQGLTDDGQYYVAAFFPVKSTFLADTVQVEDWEEFSVNYSTYMAETEATLNDLVPLDFTPDLNIMDEVVASLKVEPDVDLSGVENAAVPLELGSGQPIGVYQVYDSDTNLYHLYRVEMDGNPKAVTEQPYPLLPSPDATRAVYMDDAHRLWLVDLTDGSEKQLAEGSDLSSLQVWGDVHTLLVGVYLPADESEGLSLSTGHMATVDIDSGELQIIDEEFVSLGRPAMAPDTHSIAYDISPFDTDGTTARIFQLDAGSKPLDPSLFSGLEGEASCNLYNPTWSPNGRQLAWLCSGEAGSRLIVFDLVRQTAMTVFTWQPAQFGALPPSPVWSADGKWLAIEIWASNEDESGLWVLPADGTLARLHVPTGHNPLWLNVSQLIYSDLDENMNGDIKIVDLDYNSTGVLNLPDGSRLLLLYY